MRILVALTASLAAMTAAPAPGAAAEITGTATWRERAAAPPGAVFEAVLEDVSRADAPAVPLGAMRIENPGNPPYRIEIPYDAAAVDERMTYAVRAALRGPGRRLLFVSDTVHRVLTGGAGTSVDIVMVQAAAPPAPPPMAPGALIGGRWRLAELGGEPAPDGVDAHLAFESGQRFGGSLGCNRISGAWVARSDGAFLAGDAAMTMRLCPEREMAVEQALAQALRDARHAWLGVDGLRLGDAAGAVLARFQRVEAAALVGTRWRFEAWGEQRYAPLDGERAPPHLVFSEDGGLAGSGGCNRISARWERGADGALSLSPAATTRMACAPAAMERERSILAALGAVEAHRIEEDRLILLANGAPVATLVAEEAE